MKKGKEKKEENYIKKGGKCLKNASFWAINKNTQYISLFVARFPGAVAPVDPSLDNAVRTAAACSYSPPGI